MSEKVKAPKWILEKYGFTEQRQWRRMKRKQIKELRKAMDDTLLGSAYTPATPDGKKFIDAVSLANELVEAWSVEEWGD